MRKTNKVQAAVMAAVLAAGMPAAVFAEETSEAVSVEEASAEESAEQESGYPLTLSGTDGSEITLESEPEKIVSMGPNMTEILYALGAGDRLVGRTDYCDYPAEALEVESVGTIYEADVEKILSLEPDLVLASTHFSEESVAQLADAGVPVLYLYDEGDMEGVYGMIETIGEAVNCEDKAAEVVGLMQGKIDYVTGLVAGEEAASVYYVVGYGEYGDYTAGGDTFINGILTAAGGDNIAADVEGWSYSVETLLEKDPANIIIPAYALGDFGSAEPYSKLTAVQESRVYAIDNNMLDRQGPRNADAVVAVAAMLHPEVFPEATQYPLTVSDTDGQEVAVESDPQSVVVADGLLEELLANLGESSAMLYCDDTVEAIVSAAPELYLTGEALDEADAQALEEAGVTVLYLNPEDIVSAAETLGQVFDCNVQAAAYIYSVK